MGPPTETANVTPLDSGVGQTRLIVEAVKVSVSALKDDVSILKTDVREIRGHRVTDLLWHVGVVAAGVAIIFAGLTAAYFKIEDRLSSLSTASTRVETKLEDLLARIPPVPTPVPRKP